MYDSRGNVLINSFVILVLLLFLWLSSCKIAVMWVASLWICVVLCVAVSANTMIDSEDFVHSFSIRHNLEGNAHGKDMEILRSKYGPSKYFQRAQELNREEMHCNSERTNSCNASQIASPEENGCEDDVSDLIENRIFAELLVSKPKRRILSGSAF